MHKSRKKPFIDNLKSTACASKRDVLELATIRYFKRKTEIDNFTIINTIIQKLDSNYTRQELGMLTHVFKINLKRCDLSFNNSQDGSYKAALWLVEKYWKFYCTVGRSYNGATETNKADVKAFTLLQGLLIHQTSQWMAICNECS